MAVDAQDDDRMSRPPRVTLGVIELDTSGPFFAVRRPSRAERTDRARPACPQSILSLPCL